MTGDSMSSTKQSGSHILVNAFNKTVAMGSGLIRKNKGRLLFLFVVWIVVLVFAYLFVGVKIGQLRRNVSQSGIGMSKAFSRQCSLSLLEQDMQTLSTILHDTTSKPEVLYAAIIDHKNNIMAYTNAELIMPLNKGDSARAVDHVSFWEGLSADQQEIISFSTNVTYGGTKIGEVYLALSAAELSYWKDRFLFVVILTFFLLCIVALVLLFRDRSSGKSKSKPHKELPPYKQVPLAGMTRMTCPLCGSGKAFSSYEAVNHVNLDDFICLQPNNDGGESKGTGQADGLSLSKMAERQDMAWLKRQVVYRCTDIIRKLAA